MCQISASLLPAEASSSTQWNLKSCLASSSTSLPSAIGYACPSTVAEACVFPPNHATAAEVNKPGEHWRASSAHTTADYFAVADRNEISDRELQEALHHELGLHVGLAAVEARTGDIGQWESGFRKLPADDTSPGYKAVCSCTSATHPLLRDL